MRIFTNGCGRFFFFTRSTAFICRQSPASTCAGFIPFQGHAHLLQRRFEEAIKVFLGCQEKDGPSDAISSALAAAYHRLGIQTLADQVRRSVRSVRGNQWMFRMGHPADQPLRIRQELLQRGPDGTYPVLREQTPVRMDLTHSAWSDIFFLGMDYPEGAKVLNVSIDLGVRGRDAAPRPPIEVYLRVIDEPVLRLASVDLGAAADITHLAEVFDFAKDYLGLLKAAVIAAGIVPPGIEGSGQSLADLLARLLGPGRGLEIVSNVNNIPKGSRLAVSTNLLAALISVCMRATGQAQSLSGALREEERRLVLARAILGEWLGGSGGGWQDSGGVWPGMKLIQGVAAREGDAEFGMSRGQLMPTHHVFDERDAPAEARRKLQESLVLVHGGMAQNVGPILEMVTEKYLLRCEAEWKARQEALGILDEILAALREQDVQKIGAATSRNFHGPIQTIIPWADNFYTETLIGRVRSEFGADFWGFWMLGGMSGGGMGFIFAPDAGPRRRNACKSIMSRTKGELESALPFAMEPVVYDFAINERGTWAELLAGEDALLPPHYYALVVPQLLKLDWQTLPPLRRAELDKFAAACRNKPELRGVVQDVFDRMLPRVKQAESRRTEPGALLEENGFDRAEHEQIRADLKDGRIGLAQNRLPASAVIEDVQAGDVMDATGRFARRVFDAWPAGAGGRRSGRGDAGGGRRQPLDARGRRGQGAASLLQIGRDVIGPSWKSTWPRAAASPQGGAAVPHIFTTSYLTHAPTEEFLARQNNYGYAGPLLLSPGRAIGLRLVPTERDLRFVWEEMPQQILDEQRKKCATACAPPSSTGPAARAKAAITPTMSPRNACIPSAIGTRFPTCCATASWPACCGSARSLKYLLLHNIDSLGADLDPALLGLHIRAGACLSFEVITRRLEDRGGGLARVNGRVRIVEGLAMPREEDEFALSYYNSLSTWIDLRQAARRFRLDRGRPGRCRTKSLRPSAAGRADAHLHHAQGSQETVGPRPGRHLPRRAIREAMGRHERAAGSGLPLLRRAARCGASSSRTRPNWTAGCATAPPPGLRRCASFHFHN